MSIEALLTDLIAGVSRLAVATETNSAHLERVIAGQEAAMAKLEGGAVSGTTRKPRQPKAADTPAAEPAAAVESTPTTAAAAETPHPLLAAANPEKAPKKNPRSGVTEDAPTKNYRAGDFSRDEVKNEFLGWLGENPDADEIKARQAFVVELGNYFGVKQVFADGALDEEQRKQALFYLRRKREGLKADFSAEYDFDGDPLADQSTDDASGGDGFDALG